MTFPRWRIAKAFDNKVNESAYSRGDKMTLRHDCVDAAVGNRIIGQDDFQSATAQVIADMPRGKEGDPKTGESCFAERFTEVALKSPAHADSNVALLPIRKGPHILWSSVADQ